MGLVCYRARLRIASRPHPARVPFVLLEPLGHPHELVGELYQRRPGVEIGACDRKLATVARTLLKHFRVHGLNPASISKMPHAGRRSAKSLAIQHEWRAL